ncbi:MAG: tRNA (adenosine(37)-N6)-threonylcarbamoyltransferase complex ATPase subunit type 1 TsaE [Paracoccaceae bacterium]|nr:tRNA (adenosine(37)-N6)-threonylcarbamoyltransferase complex ATPase subunit type 1 TsaE [Paracoccaceae bacterium]
MVSRTARRILSSPDNTAAFARALGTRLHPGDVLLLSGPIGAGKSHFARALIQSLQDTPEDVPSPTFTLVQVYDTRAGELWHADLYRLSDPDQCVELGLTDAFETAICLIEWPDRLTDLTPQNALEMRFSAGQTEKERILTLDWTDPRWNVLLSELAA